MDTHKELHVAAVVDAGETVLGTRTFSTTRAGYRALVAWMGEYGQLARIGVEGTGSYGAGLTRHLAKAGVMIGGRPARPLRPPPQRQGRRPGRDQCRPGRAAQPPNVVPKSKDGAVEALRVLRSTRAQAVRNGAAPCNCFG